MSRIHLLYSRLVEVMYRADENIVYPWKFLDKEWCDFMIDNLQILLDMIKKEKYKKNKSYIHNTECALEWYNKLNVYRVTWID